jgi:lipopolysaccharide biosynthesis glycosyltransferase
MNILVTTDRNYLQHAYVMLASLLENNPDAPIDIFYLHYDIDDMSQAKFKDFFSSGNIRITFLKIGKEKLQGLRGNFYITIAAYLRVLCPDLLPDTVRRILYLDPDMIVKKPLADLYATDLGQSYLAAVAEYKLGARRKPVLKIPDEYEYFNSGVMVIDIEKFRQEKISKKVLDFSRKTSVELICCDQDALNAVLYDKWMMLHPRWNVLGEVDGEFPDLSTQIGREIRGATDDPAIIHFAGKPKPWEYCCRNPFRKEYWYYLGKTPYRDFKRTGLFRSYSAAIRLLLLKAMTDYFPKSIKDLVPLRLKNMIIKMMLKTDKHTPGLTGS